MIRTCKLPDGRPGYQAEGAECHPYEPGNVASVRAAITAAARDANRQVAAEVQAPAGAG